MIRKNVLANVLGGSWVALLSLLIIPVQIRLLGVEAYGLLAFLASLQVMLSIFDLGLSPTMTREVATLWPDAQAQVRALVRTLLTIYIGLGAILGVVLIASSSWLATHWLNLQTLPVYTAAAAIRLGGAAMMLRWPVSLLSGIIAGRQRFDILNKVRATAATLGLVGGAIVILFSSSLLAFLAWMVVAAAMETTLYLVACARMVPGLLWRPAVEVAVLRRVWRFALSTNLITVLSIALTQSDRLLISALLPTRTLGYYSLAYNVVYGLTLVQSFITSAVFPAFADDHRRGRLEALAQRYRKAAQALTYISAAPTTLLMFFAYDVLRLWVSVDSARGASQILPVLALGSLISVAMSAPHALAVATGHTEIPLLVNLAAVVLYVPVLVILVLRWEGVGAALAWLLLNIAYVLSLLPLVQGRIVGQRTIDWLTANVIPFVVSGIIAFGTARAVLVATGWAGPFQVWGTIALAGLAYAVTAFLFLDRSLRADIRSSLKAVVGVGSHVG